MAALLEVHTVIPFFIVGSGYQAAVYFGTSDKSPFFNNAGIIGNFSSFIIPPDTLRDMSFDYLCLSLKYKVPKLSGPDPRKTRVCPAFLEPRLHRPMRQYLGERYASSKLMPLLDNRMKCLTEIIFQARL